MKKYKKTKALEKLDWFLFSHDPLKERTPFFTSQGDLIDTAIMSASSPYARKKRGSFKTSINLTFNGERNLNRKDEAIIAYALSVKIEDSEYRQEIKTMFYDLAAEVRNAWKEQLQSNQQVSEIIYKAKGKKRKGHVLYSFPGNLPVSQSDIEHIRALARDVLGTFTLGKMMKALGLRWELIKR